MQTRNTAILNEKLLDACVPTQNHTYQPSKGIRLTSLEELLPPQDQLEYVQIRAPRLPVQYNSPNKTTQDTISSTMTFMSPPKATVYCEAKVLPRQVKIQNIQQRQVRLPSPQLVIPVKEKAIEHPILVQQRRISSPNFRPITPLNQVLKIQQPKQLQSPVISNPNLEKSINLAFSRSVNVVKSPSPIKQAISQKKFFTANQPTSLQKQGIVKQAAEPIRMANPAPVTHNINSQFLKPQQKEVNNSPQPVKLPHTLLQKEVLLSVSKAQIPQQSSKVSIPKPKQANVCTQTDQIAKNQEAEYRKQPQPEIRIDDKRHPNEEIIHHPLRHHKNFQKQYQLSSIFSNNFLKEKRRSPELPPRQVSRKKEIKKSSVGIGTNMHCKDIENLERAYQEYIELSKIQNQRSKHSYSTPQNYEAPFYKYHPTDIISKTKSNSKTSILSPLDLSELMKQEETIEDQDNLSIRELRMERILKKYRSQDSFGDYRY